MSDPVRSLRGAWRYLAGWLVFGLGRVALLLALDGPAAAFSAATLHDTLCILLAGLAVTWGARAAALHLRHPEIAEARAPRWPEGSSPAGALPGRARAPDPAARNRDATRGVELRGRRRNLSPGASRPGPATPSPGSTGPEGAAAGMRRGASIPVLAALVALGAAAGGCSGPALSRLPLPWARVGVVGDQTTASGAPLAAASPVAPAAPPAAAAPRSTSASSAGSSTAAAGPAPAGPVLLPAGTPPPVPEPAAGWLPADRIVAYYGNPLSAAMGVLAWYPPAQAMRNLTAQAAAYAQADPTHPVVPAIELVADVAQASAGADGDYRQRMPYSLLNTELALARQTHALLILDIQVGRSTVQQELPYFLPFLSQPDVMLALDPEFDMPPGELPGRSIGTMSATDINWAVSSMSTLVSRLGLPPKIVIVHQFTDDMVLDWQDIQLQSGVQFVMDTDGFGGQGIKLANYQRYIAQRPIPPASYGGIKLFYKYDIDLMTPAQVVALHPTPSLVIYQ